MTDLFYLAGNQLFEPGHLSTHRDAVVVMVECEKLCRRLPFHQQKLGLLLSAMREHAATLSRAGFDVRYFDLDQQMTLNAAITKVASQVGARRLVHFDSEDRGLLRELDNVAGRLDISRCAIDSPAFLLDNATVDGYFSGASRPRMSSFYRSQRLRFNLLVENNQPLGGQWSFDSQNRARLPRHQAIPELPPVHRTTGTEDCLRLVSTRFGDHPGEAQNLWLPVTRDGAIAWLDRFLQERLIGFGTFEDAMTTRSPVLFHSALSPLLNLGLVTPAEVVARALDAGEEFRVPLNDLEGFLRQIVGWREFVRGVYRHHRHTMRKRNVWGSERRLSASWLNGRTGLEPLDRAVCGALSYGWNHHIERLMVIANLMNLAEIHPEEVYRFFMTHYIDAYDWVMVPNVFGMGLASDGGIFTTKPYICGSNYIRKMSDYPKGDWTEIMDGLYWRFIAKHRRIHQTNPRQAMMIHALDRIDPTRLKQLIARAENFIADNTLEAV